MEKNGQDSKARESPLKKQLNDDSSCSFGSSDRKEGERRRGEDDGGTAKRLRDEIGR